MASKGKRLVRKYRIEGEGVNVLEASIYYDLGGINYFSYKNEPRGYWFALQPFEDKDGWRSFVAYSGVKTCVLPCERQSAKRYAEAKGMLDALIERHLPDFLDMNGIALLDGGAYAEYER
jgi:hypothetical protein